MESSKNTMQIICIIFFARAAFLDAQINNVRLVGGNSPAEGRVEVLYNGEWGTVCDDNFDDKDAAVVCSMLGYSRMNAKSKQQAFFGQGTGRIWMDQLECTDYDSNIFNCSQNILGTHDCGHYKDAGVVCNMFADCGNADILIIMDESGSVGSNHFNTMKTFVQDVIRGLNSVFFRFSVITYSNSPRKIFGFRNFDNLNAIIFSI
ncbi:scavenger receptor class A member 5-like [Magallana gigas]|uniref:scavenger receptor class A member 5-like n=1 Tax=Magallana gigas TaxID=29159 RepID=UPI00333F3E34